MRETSGMKKLVAALLCMAVLGTCVACTSDKSSGNVGGKIGFPSGETETTEAPTETEPTDTSETEGTSDTSASSDPTESETEATSSITESETETTETTAAPSSTDLVVSNDLKPENIGQTRDVMKYGAVDSHQSQDYGIFLSDVDVEYDVMTAEGGSPSVKKILDEYTWHNADACSRAFEKKREEFVNLEKTGSALFDYTYRMGCEVIRADSQILSFCTTIYYYETNEDSRTSRTYENYRSSDGSEILLSDVVKDQDAFANYLYSYLKTVGNEDPNEAVSRIQGGDFSFGMTYDGIYYNGIKIPVAGYGDIFDMSYFGSTPKSFTLSLGSENKLVWDFNGDGILDELALTVNTGSSQYDVESVTISLYGKKTVLHASDFEEMDWMEELDPFDGSHVMCVNGKYYLLMTMDCEGEDYYTYIFDINGEAPVYVEYFESKPSSALDPNHFLVSERVEIMGTMFMDFEYALTEDGHIKQLSTMAKCHRGLFLTIMPLTGNEYDIVTDTVGAEMELPSSARVEVIGYDTESGLLILRAYSRFDDAEMPDIALKTDKNSTIGGKKREEAFIGIMFAD